MSEVRFAPSGPSLTVGDVESVFGRDGAVVAASGDYSASQVTNNSQTVAGPSVADALDNLQAAIPAPSTSFQRLGTYSNTTAGATDPAVAIPAGTTQIRVEMVGAGGNGAGCSKTGVTTTYDPAGGGGGSGGYYRGTFERAAGFSGTLTVTIGAAGATSTSDGLAGSETQLQMNTAPSERIRCGGGQGGHTNQLSSNDGEGGVGGFILVENFVAGDLFPPTGFGGSQGEGVVAWASPAGSAPAPGVRAGRGAPSPLGPGGNTFIAAGPENGNSPGSGFGGGGSGAHAHAGQTQTASFTGGIARGGAIFLEFWGTPP